MTAISTPALQGNSLQLSQVDLIKRLDPSGGVAEIAEILNETNEIIPDIKFKEGNLPTGDQQTVRTSLPDVYYSQYNRGVPASRSSVATIEETCARMEAYSKLDVRVADLNGFSAQFRRQEERPFIEAMGQKLTSTLFYGNAGKVKEEFNGFATRYNSFTASKCPFAKNVIDCGATSSSTKRASIWIIAWGDGIYCPYPKGSKVGLQSEDMGVQLVNDDLGNQYRAYVNMFSWNVGLMVRDWRMAVRLCNIDVDALFAGSGIGAGDISTANSTNILLKIEEALTKFPRRSGAKVAMYMNSDVHAGLNVVAERVNSNVITFQQSTDAYGSHKAWTSIAGVPIRQVDQLTNSETLVA